jgi:hypothetical protein
LKVQASAKTEYFVLKKKLGSREAGLEKSCVPSIESRVAARKGNNLADNRHSINTEATLHGYVKLM